MIDWIRNFELNSRMGVLLYWVPLGFCLFGYVVRTGRNYITDKRMREEEPNRYRPTDTIGDLIGRGVVSVIPVANLLAAVFDVSTEVFGRFFRLLSKLFDQPLVPKKVPE